jgi:hypothetical protein
MKRAPVWQSPVLTFVVPTGTAPKVYRAVGDTKGRSTANGTELLNVITAMGANQITVGSALNQNSVVYDVWAITTRVVTP